MANNTIDEEIAQKTLIKIKNIQNETRKTKWSTVKIIKNNDLLILENILQALLSRNNSALAFIYDATKHYVEKYNPKYGTGLIVDSIPMLEKIVCYWEQYDQ